VNNFQCLVTADVSETERKCLMVRAQFYPSYQLASPLPYHKQASNLVTNLRSYSFICGNAYRQKHVVKPAIAVN